MKLHFFTVVAMSPEADQDSLNAFLANHRVVTVDKELVQQGVESFWTVCVSYIAGAEPQRAHLGGKRERIDYREVLSETDFAAYVSLRDLRKAMAEREGVPAYALFTNEQLAEMVTRRATSLVALAEIEGVGKARLDKYGIAFLAALGEVLTKEKSERDETSADQP